MERPGGRRLSSKDIFKNKDWWQCWLGNHYRPPPDMSVEEQTTELLAFFRRWPGMDERGLRIVKAAFLANVLLSQEDSDEE
jgi:hypothetical protein